MNSDLQRERFCNAWLLFYLYIEKVKKNVLLIYAPLMFLGGDFEVVKWDIVN